MHMRSIVFAVAALLLSFAGPLTTHAEDQPKFSAEEIAKGQAKAQIANGLIVLGRAAKDPDLLIAAAKVLASIGAKVADPQASATKGFYDVGQIVEEAKSYSANRSADVAPGENRAGFCHYEYLCDSLSCSYVWVC